LEVVVHKHWKAHKQTDNEKVMHNAAVAQYGVNSYIIILLDLYVFIATVLMETV
jgi:hypothetical protein